MVKRLDMTRPRMRLTEGKDPTAAIERLYGSRQLDKGNGLVSVDRNGVLKGSPTGFKSSGPTHCEPQDRESRPAPGSGGKVRGWVYGGGDATKQANFDHSKRGRR